MTELRSKMIKSMELRNFSKNTQRSYLKAVSGLAKHYKKSPDKILILYPKKKISESK